MTTIRVEATTIRRRPRHRYLPTITTNLSLPYRRNLALISGQPRSLRASQAALLLLTVCLPSTLVQTNIKFSVQLYFNLIKDVARHG